MNKEDFIKDLNYLKSYFLNWNFDFTNLFALEIWYEKFKDFTDRDFIELLKKYCSETSYPPNSPSDLLKIIPKEYSIEEAWQIVLDILKLNTEESYILRELSKYPTLYKCIQGIDLKNVEVDSYGNKCYGYSIGRIFKRKYKAYLDSIKIKFINNKLSLPSNNNLRLTTTNLDKPNGGFIEL